ncbi:SH2 domain protein A [Quillaja saponaria]|uniref:SH2 domain protein A n=1 Tax=Quillaja saponaria TaxID=32244 RepID=A0AAD7QJH3_QUISA|nr:SH2 domain protein A [Quillaja saponaria]
MGTEAMRSEEYSLLKDLRLEFEGKDGTFSLCFWVYLMSSTAFPATIIHQVHADITHSAPFLIINKNKKMMLLPSFLLHQEAPEPANITSWTEVPHANMDFEFPLEKWVHVGCEVSTDYMRLHINGEIAGERSLSSLLSKDSTSSCLRKITLASIGRDGSPVQDYVHNMEVFPLTSSITDHYVKDPPLKLSIDKSSASEIEEGSDGVWSIVGGKASCRRNFSLDVVLLDAFGQPANKDTEVIASLVYAENGEPVENTTDAEAPLLASYDGIEFSSCERPSKLLQGRASFKLKISQLSSKCDNRLFVIRFHMPKFGNYPFLETSSPRIRCISRSRNTRLSTLVWKRPTSALHRLSLSQSSAMDDESSGFQQNSENEAKASPLLKRFRLGHDKISVSMKGHPTLEQPDEDCNSHAWTANQVENGFTMTLEGRPENLEGADDSSSDSDSIGERNSHSMSMSSRRNPISDTTIFKYCLAGLSERSLMLKEIGTSSSDQEISELAHQVSLYSGCSHHKNQILIAKRLIEEGTKAWNVISQNNNPVPWENAVFEIEEQFMKIACCSSRTLTQQDFELLRRIAGCREYLAQDNFEKMWCWLYPVAFSISRDWINAIWSSASPKWIEGFITKEESESSLQGPRGIQEPGTFVLRFPTSRSWPHPDAGSLIVSYVGSDYNLHHRLLSVDHIYSSGEKEMDVKPLQDMLLAEPELTRLGRIIRSH